MNDIDHIEEAVVAGIAELLTAEGPQGTTGPETEPGGIEAQSVLFAGARKPLAAWLLAEAVAQAGLGPGGEARLLVVTPDGTRAEELASDLHRFLSGPASGNQDSLRDTDEADRGDKEDLRDDTDRSDKAGKADGAGKAGRDGIAEGFVTLIPEPEALPYSDISQDPAADQEFCGALFRLTQGMTGPVVVASAQALARKVIPQDAFDVACDMLGPGETLDREELAARLVAAGYRRMPVVDEPGCFAMRGAIIDLFTPAMGRPVRLELDGDEIESVRFFDPDSQRSLEECAEVFVHPVRQTLVTDPEGLRGRLVEAAEATGCPSSQVRHATEAMSSGMDFYGSEALLPAFHRRLDPLSAYLPRGIRVLVEDAARVESVLARLSEHLTEGYRHFTASGRLTFEPDRFFLGALRAEDLLDRPPAGWYVTTDSPAGGPVRFQLESQDLADLTAQTRQAAAQPGAEVFAPLAGQLRKWIAAQWRVALVSPDARAADRMAKFLKGYGIEVALAGQDRSAARILSSDNRLSAGRRTEDRSTGKNKILSGSKKGSRDPSSTRSNARGRGGARQVGPPRPSGPARQTEGKEAGGASGPGGVLAGQVTLWWGRVSSGFVWPQAKLALVSEAELFGSASRRRHQGKPRGRALEDLGQLKDGDYVVHEIHGVGRYEGLVREVVGGVPADFMAIRYAGTDRLFVPVHRFSVVRRYLGGSPDHKPPLDKLGGVTWGKRKAKVSAQVRKLAEQLLRLHAERKLAKGFAYPEGGELMAAFEASFPYEETPDQLAAIQAVLDDMTSDRPMDRLVCGDVGYGKTEVAMRAAVLAALAGKQVAVLAPTTVLVEQHLRSFSARMRMLPIQVAALSRMTPKSRQNEILADLADGKVDILVGTHRLLSSDIRFKNLGLVIIDEEQRFGVAQKERLKELRTEVDVLSLTATPIPRTLQMAMVGIRDLSIIATAPVDRTAVKTYVTSLSPLTLIEAMRHELKRGGQVFFVVPRIGEGGKDYAGDGLHSIEYWAKQIKEWVPEADLALAHGRMDARRLERVMVDFVAGRHQILVSTSIIESGLDIPDANTMIVMDADHFGMAQLYQLRGRVGRSGRQAYCYFVVPSLSGLTKKASKRLAALERLSGLGAAFNLSLEDMEIRGAGDILGARQSGQVSAVGYDTYVRLLEEAVAELSDQPAPGKRDCDMSYDVPAFLPDEWIADPGRRLHYYQLLSSAQTDEDVEAIMAELLDLYGHPSPTEAELLAQMTKLRIHAADLGAQRLELAGSRLVLDLGPDTPLDPRMVLDLIRNDRRYRITPRQQIIFKITADGGGSDGPNGPFVRLDAATRGLRKLRACVIGRTKNPGGRK